MVIGQEFKIDRGRRWSRKRGHVLILKHSRRRTCIVIPIRRRKQNTFNVHSASLPVVIDCDFATATVPVDDTVGRCSRQAPRLRRHKFRPALYFGSTNAWSSLDPGCCASSTK